MWRLMLSNGGSNERVREKKTTYSLQTKVDCTIAVGAINKLHGSRSIDEIREGRVSGTTQGSRDGVGRQDGRGDLRSVETLHKDEIGTITARYLDVSYSSGDVYSIISHFETSHGS